MNPLAPVTTADIITVHSNQIHIILMLKAQFLLFSTTCPAFNKGKKEENSLKISSIRQNWTQK